MTTDKYGALAASVHGVQTHRLVGRSKESTDAKPAGLQLQTVAQL